MLNLMAFNNYVRKSSTKKCFYSAGRKISLRRLDAEYLVPEGFIDYSKRTTKYMPAYLSINIVALWQRTVFIQFVWMSQYTTVFKKQH